MKRLTAGSAEPTLDIRNLNFSFAGAESPLLRRVNLTFKSGELALICGPTGSGKTTLLKCVNSLAPAFTGGTRSGQIIIDGEDVSRVATRDLANRVGYVSQQPEASFVAETVIEELVFGMEQLGVALDDMRLRVADVASRLRLEDLLQREVAALSGGEQQRLAIAAAIAAGANILLLDEPTSALDDQNARACIDLLRELADHGMTVVVVEHRIERILDIADSITIVNVDGSVTQHARRDARAALALDPRMSSLKLERPAASKSGILIQSVDEPDFWFQDLTASFKLNRKQSKTVVGPTNLELTQGEVLGIVGANGSGKSSLLWELMRRTEAVLVPQSASDLLFLPTVAHEFAESDRFAKVSRGKTASIFEGLVGKVDPLRHPRDLSAGMQLALAIAVQLVKESRLILLDEPTRGLDYLAKSELAAMLGKLQVEGKTLVIASHDRDFLQVVCGRVLRLQDGQLRQEITSYDAARHESKRNESRRSE